jgi:hypothetical protein
MTVVVMDLKRSDNDENDVDKTDNGFFDVGLACGAFAAIPRSVR